MSRLPVEQTGESTAGDSMRTIPTPFLTKTYQLADDPSLDDMISWNEDGSAFIVWRPCEFARDLLPKYFKHNNFSSFVRQLNTYGFRKVMSDRWEFANECFRRGEKELLREIQRRKISTPPPVSSPATETLAVPVPLTVVPSSPANSGDEQVVSSTSSPTATIIRCTTCTPTTDLLEENQWLKKENAQLSQELSRLRGLCNNVFNLMSNFASGGPDSRVLPEEKALDLLRTEEVEKEFTLFGVAIGMKRMKRCEDEEIGRQGQDEMQMQGSDVKSEPLDSGTTQHHDPPWIDKS